MVFLRFSGDANDLWWGHRQKTVIYDRFFSETRKEKREERA